MSNPSPSGIIGTVKEMSAAMRSAIQDKNDFPDNKLITQLVQKTENWEEAKEKMADYRGRAQQRLKAENATNREESTDLALNKCKSAIELVENKYSTQDATAYKQWTINVARAVAEAAKDGSILAGVWRRTHF